MERKRLKWLICKIFGHVFKAPPLHVDAWICERCHEIFSVKAFMERGVWEKYKE